MTFARHRAALAFSAAAATPFLYGAVVVAAPEADVFRLGGRWVLEVYGLIAFAYMSGVYRGFAAAAGKVGWGWTSFAVLPAAAVFLTVLFNRGAALATLTVGYPALIGFDLAFWRVGAAPGWWVASRAMLIAVATACLIFGAAR